VHSSADPARHVPAAHLQIHALCWIENTIASPMRPLRIICCIVERLGAAAYLVGRDEEAAYVWGRAHRQGLRVGDIPRAAGCAFWSAGVLLNKGELAHGRRVGQPRAAAT